jgi:maltodextrin utilization protein YvdJ
MQEDVDTKYLETRLNACYQNLQRAVINFKIDDQTLSVMRKEALELIQKIEKLNQEIQFNEENRRAVKESWDEHIKTYTSFLWLLKISSIIIAICLIALYLLLT